MVHLLYLYGSSAQKGVDKGIKAAESLRPPMTATYEICSRVQYAFCFLKMWPLPAAKGCRHLLNLNWGFPAGGCPPHKPWSYLANKYEHVMCNNQLFACIKALFCPTMKLKAPNLNQRKRKRPIIILLCKRERERDLSCF